MLDASLLPVSPHDPRVTRESDRMIANGTTCRLPLPIPGVRESGSVNISPVADQSVGGDPRPAHAATTRTSRTTSCRRDTGHEEWCSGGGQRMDLLVKETPVIRMIRYLQSLPPDRPIRRELTEFAFWKSVRTEFLATAVFVVMSLGPGICSSDSLSPDPLTQLSAAVATGLTVATLMYLTSNQIANYKSCHLSPCLTLALLISQHHDNRHHRRVTPVRLLLFVVVQLLASLAGASVLRGLLLNQDSLHPDIHAISNSSFSLSSAVPQPAARMRESNVFGFEFLATFLFTLTYFAVTDERKVRKESLGTLTHKKRELQSMRERRSGGTTRTTDGRRTRSRSHGNEDSSGLIRDREQRQAKQTQPDDQNTRHRKHQIGSHCHASSGQSDERQQENPSPKCREGHEEQAMLEKERPQSAKANLSLRPSSSSSCCCSSCCSPSVHSSSFTSSSSSGWKTRCQAEDWDSGDMGCQTRFAFVGFAVTTAHLFSVSHCVSSACV